MSKNVNLIVKIMFVSFWESQNGARRCLSLNQHTRAPSPTRTQLSLPLHLFFLYPSFHTSSSLDVWPYFLSLFLSVWHMHKGYLIPLTQSQSDSSLVPCRLSSAVSQLPLSLHPLFTYCYLFLYTIFSFLAPLSIPLCRFPPSLTHTLSLEQSSFYL